MRTIISLIVITFSLPIFFTSAQEKKNDLDNTSQGLMISVFDMDVTPPIGYKMPYGIVINKDDLGLRAKGLVLTGIKNPVVLVSIDWLGISNDCYEEFKHAIARAAGTLPEHVAVHVIHQHDAPYPRDFTNDSFALSVIHRLEMTVVKSLETREPVTHMGYGEAEVFEVASNRRILGEDGKVRAMRWTACKDASLRNEPEGLIDPMLSTVSFWNKNKPVAILNFYATHPQSYYSTGIANPDYPGIARYYRQLAIPDALSVYFTGAGGNVGAGKYNDGAHENRGILAGRLADGMKRAWEGTKKSSVDASTFQWSYESISLPLDSAKAGKALWERSKSGKKVDIQCLSFGNSSVLFLPGELTVEYQLAAKKMKPDQHIAMAAYGDLGFGYIPSAKAFPQGGYEVDAAKIIPEAENVLLSTISKLLDRHQKNRDVNQQRNKY